MRRGHRGRCEKEVFGIFTARASGMSDGSTTHTLDFSDLPLDTFSDVPCSSSSSDDGLSRFVILLEPPALDSAVQSSEGSAITQWPELTPEMMALGLKRQLNSNEIRLEHNKEKLIRALDDEIAHYEQQIEETTGAIARLENAPDLGILSILAKRLVDLETRSVAKKKDRDALDPSELPRSFFDDVDAAARALPVVSSFSTLSGFIHPSLYLRGPALRSPKGRGVWSSAPIPAWTMIELSPALLVPSAALLISDERHYPDAPVHNALSDYAFPAPQGLSGDNKYSLLPLGWIMMYNHCSEEGANSAWESVRYGVQKASIPNRFSSFAVRFFTTRDVEAGEEICWNYGENYWNPHMSHRLQEES